MTLTTSDVQADAKRIEKLIRDMGRAPRGSKWDRLYAEQLSLSTKLAKEFGKRHGWKLSERYFVLDQLARRSNTEPDEDDLPLCHSLTEVLDHPYYYRVKGRPAAIAAHLYNVELDEIADFADANRVAF